MTNRINPYKLFVGAFVPNWLMERKEITPGEKLCYARLCQFAGKKGVAYPKLETLANELACSVSQVQRYLNTLLEHKLIQKDRIGLQAANRYYFLDHKWITEEDSENSDCQTSNNQTCSDMHNQTCSDLNNPIERESEEIESSMFIGPKGPIKGTKGSLDLKSKEGGTRKLIKRKTSNPCSSGDVKKSDLIRKALNGERLASKPLIRVKHKHKVRVPDNVQDVVDYWARKGLTVHGETTVSLATAVRYIKELYEGTLFNGMKSNYYHDRKFSLREIKLSIDNFVLALTSNEHMPVNKDWLKRTTLSGFFYNPRAIKHPFLQYLAKPDLVINSKAFQSTDTKPVVTNVLLDWWGKFEESRHPMTVQVKNHCVLAGKKLEAFYEENKNRFLWGTHGNQIAILAQKLTECLDKELRENDSLYSVFDSRWLISDKTFNERLPRYLISSKKMRASKGGTAPETEYEAIYTL